jgi:hypothetical protein
MTSALGGLNLRKLDVGTYWKMPAMLIIFTDICCGAGMAREAGSISHIYLIKHNY